MLKDMFKNYVYPVATLAGSIIGVGIFSLPYVAMRSDIWLMLLYFFVLTFLIIIIHLAFTEISLKTPDFKRFPGFVRYHLGKKAEALAFATVIFGGFGVLLAYLIVGSEFLFGIFQPYFRGSPLLYTIIYFAVASSIVWLGINAVSKAELFALLLLFISFIIIFVTGFSQIKLNNIFVSDFGFRALDFFLPFGPLLFALWGTGMIPEVEEMLSNKKSIKKIVIISTLIPAVIYLFFVFLILGITGNQTTESALTGLKNFLGGRAYAVALFAGVTTTFAAFIAQGLTLKKVLIYDLKIKKLHAFLITCLTPIVLFMLGMKSFIFVVSFTGGVLLLITGVLILFMYKKIHFTK